MSETPTKVTVDGTYTVGLDVKVQGDEDIRSRQAYVAALEDAAEGNDLDLSTGRVTVDDVVIEEEGGQEVAIVYGSYVVDLEATVQMTDGHVEEGKDTTALTDEAAGRGLDVDQGIIEVHSVH